MRAMSLKLAPDDVEFLKEAYRPRALVGPVARPGEKPLAGTDRVK